VLGDSFVEALQVDLDDTFAALLERHLDVEVLNLGVSGYSTDNELRTFVGRGRRYAPDAVLLVLHVGNDVLENGARLYLSNPHGLPPKPWLRSRDPSRGLAACLALHRAAAHVASSVPGILWQDSRLVRAGLTKGVSGVLRTACAGTLDAPLVPGVPEFRGVYGAPETRAWTEAWTTTEHLLVHLARRVRASGMRFAVAVGPAGLEYDPSLAVDEGAFPATRSRAWDFDYPHRRLAALFAREGITSVDLLPALRAHFEATGRSGCHPFDGHWDREGHRVVADALAGPVETLVESVRPSLLASGLPTIAHPEEKR
jgi:hypothetical protein